MNQKYTTESLIEKCKSIHGNEYSYSHTVYKGYNEKIIVTCKEHGDFTISINKHLYGQGCPICRYKKASKTKRRSVNDAIQEMIKVHGNEYDYSLITEYINNKVKLPIICKEHGIFHQSFDNHVKKGQGCPKCAIKKQGERQRLNTDIFIDKCKKVHGDVYDYSKVEYTLSQNEVSIICSKHGEFKQIARNHLFGQGCPKCFSEKSKVEKEILEYIKTLIQDKQVIENDRSVLNGKEIDIYLPDYQIGFEINGLIWHSEKFQDNKNQHLEKNIECSKKGIHLIHIFEDDWYYKQHIIKSRIKNLLHKSDNIIYARKCIIKEIPYYESEIFLNQHHIQGNCVSKYRYGLYYNDELVSIMTFGKLRRNVGFSIKNDNNYELLRFCNKINTNVIGGASKLFKHFIKTHNVESIISYADRCWSNGKVYEKLNFIKYNESKPSYYYVVNKKRVNRFNLRKDVLVKKYNCPKNITEHEFCLSQKWYRIYDCGCLCYVWKNQTIL